MNRGFKIAVCLVLLVLLPAPALARYRSSLEKWTRGERVYVLDNLEARVIWKATYLSDEFRAARREKLAKLYEWSDVDRRRGEQEDREESSRWDVFFLGIYSGSSQWSEIGKDEGKWRIVLQVDGGEVVEPVGLERIPITMLERTLYPYLDKWSRAYLLKFPKTTSKGRPFRLRMTGIPARSELVWK